MRRPVETDEQRLCPQGLRNSARAKAQDEQGASSARVLRERRVELVRLRVRVQVRFGASARVRNRVRVP